MVKIPAYQYISAVNGCNGDMLGINEFPFVYYPFSYIPFFQFVDFDGYVTFGRLHLFFFWNNFSRLSLKI